MIKFRTELPLYPNGLKIRHKDEIFVIGSCFSSSIGQKLQQNKFKCVINPFGTLFHPIPILQNLNSLVKNESIKDEDIVLLDERFVHFGMHSSIHAKSRENLARIISEIRKSAKLSISRSSVAFITYGTAFHYYHQKKNTVVANCHKQPNDFFRRCLSSVSELSEQLDQTLELLSAINPNIQIVLTLSPVRHKRDGLIANNRSKSHLLSAIHSAVESHQNAHYFPSYELVLDDLRNYRFFKADLIHPNDLAIDYIWSYFAKIFFEKATIGLNEKASRVTNFLNHIPFDPQSATYKKHLEEILDTIISMEKSNQICFKTERDLINEKLESFAV